MDRLSDQTIIYPDRGQKKERTTLTTSTSKRRLRTLERPPADQLPPMRPTRRDLAVLHTVYKYRVLTTHQIEALLFAPSPGRPYSRKKRCQARLRLAFLHGYLFRDEQPAKLSEGKQPLVYSLDKKGIEYLAGELDLPPKEVAKRSSPRLTAASYSFLRHTLSVNELQILLELSARKGQVEIKEWRDEHTLRQYRDKVTVTGPRKGKQDVTVVPDLYVLLSTGENDFHNFFEVDLKTVVIEYDKDEGRDCARKTRAYIEYLESGKYQKRYPAAGKSMRVLYVTLSELRLNHLMSVTEKVAGKRKSRFWFTTFDRLTPDTIATEPVCKIAGREGLHPLVW